MTRGVANVGRWRQTALPGISPSDIVRRVSIEVSARVGAVIIGAAARAGVDAAALAKATGFDPALAADPDARIPLAEETRLWDEAARLVGDAAFGLHAARGLAPGAFDVLDYAVRTAPTLRESLERLALYNRLVHDAAVFTIVDRGDVTRVEHRLAPPGAVQSPHAADFTLASIVEIGGQLANKRIAPRAVELHHAAIARSSEYRAVFGVTPRFGAEVNAVELGRALVDESLPSADPALYNVIRRHADALLAARPAPSESTTDRVRRLLADALGEGQATLKAVAGRLKMSQRSLQRRLADEGVTFDALLDELRRDLALRYLSDRRIAIAEVAYLLGYSEPSPFHRAFKRWTGVTPSEVRRRAA